MIKISTATYSLSKDELSSLIESYRITLPKVERVSVCLKNPIHQLAALYACLLEGNRVFSQNSFSSPNDLDLSNKLFSPEYIIDKELSLNHEHKLSCALSPDSGLLAIATSGSSGTPKIVLIKPSALIASAHSSNDFYQLNDKDVVSSPLPLHHIGGIMPFWRALEAKAELVLADNQSWLKACVPRASQISLIPTQLQYLLKNDFNWKNLKSIIIGAQALDEKTYNRAMELNLPLSVSYGSSESVAQLSATHPNQKVNLSVGKILNRRQVKINDGLLCFKGEACFWGYQEGNRDIFPFDEDGFFHTQDLVELDNDKNLYIKGRSDHIYKSGGENINPLELERRVSTDLKLENCYISPLTDANFGNINAISINNIQREDILKIFKLNQTLPSFQKVRFINSLNLKHSSLKVSRSILNDEVQTNFNKWNLEQLNNFDSKKQSIVFMHGFLGNSKSLSSLAQYFEDHFNVWVLDLPFHGNHTGYKYQDWNHIIDELASLLIRFNDLWIYGYSMGGRLGLGLIDRYPGLVKKAIIEASHPGLSTSKQRLERQIFEKSIIAKMDNFNQFITDWYTSPLFDLGPDEINTLQSLKYNSKADYEQALVSYGLSNQPYLSHVLESEQVMCIAGELDHKYLELMNSPLVIPNCAHKSSFQAPKAVFQAISSYLAKNNWHPSFK